MYDTTDVLILAFGWMAIFEGVSPLLFPETWRRAVRELVEQPESALRNFGGVLAGCGLCLVWYVLG